MSLWPQYVYICLLAIGAGVSLAKYGEPKTGKWGFTELLISPALSIALLYYGGFFAPLGWTP